jgi:hypothetical protein
VRAVLLALLASTAAASVASAQDAAPFADVALFADMVGHEFTAADRPPNLRTVEAGDVSFTYVHWDDPDLRCRLTNTPDWERVARVTCGRAYPSEAEAEAGLGEMLAAMAEVWGERYDGRRVYTQEGGTCVWVSRGWGQGPDGWFSTVTMEPRDCE